MSINVAGPVLVGVDGSSASLLAVDLAAEEALRRVTPLVVLHVRGGAAASGPAATVDDGRRTLAAAVRRARDRC